MKVVIIAGGQGTRIASVNSEIPKAMIPIEGEPILEYQVELARRYGYTDFLFIIGYLGDQIQAYFGDGSQWGVTIEYYREMQPLGTAGALGLLKDKLTEDFFVFYGDTVMDFDMAAMLAYHQSQQADATLFLHPNDHPYDSDIVRLKSYTSVPFGEGEEGAGPVVYGRGGRVECFCNKPHEEDFVSHNMVNAALFIFSPKILSVIEPNVKCHIEKHVLPRCLEAGMRLFGYVSPEYIKDMGTPDRYYAVCEDVRSGKVTRLNRVYARSAIFLDRDGVINREVNLLNRPEQMELLPGAAEAIRLINQAGYLAIVITNQPVLARNLCTFEEEEYINEKMETLLGREHAYLNAIYLCPHHPDGGYPEERKELKIKCACRKPAPGMILQAAEDWNIDLKHSFMIGDSNRDIEAGNNAGVGQNILIPTNEDNALLNTIKQILL